jgi:hypothetical protein
MEIGACAPLHRVVDIVFERDPCLGSLRGTVYSGAYRREGRADVPSSEATYHPTSRSDTGWRQRRQSCRTDRADAGGMQLLSQEYLLWRFDSKGDQATVLDRMDTHLMLLSNVYMYKYQESYTLVTHAGLRMDLTFSCLSRAVNIAEKGSLGWG